MNRNVMRLAFLILLCFCYTGVFRAVAQPNGEVYLDPVDKTRDTLDFDITLFGKPLAAYFIVENTGTATIFIPKKTVPFFSIERYTTDPTDFRHLEFSNVEPIPFEVKTAKVRDTFLLEFVSNRDTTKLDYALGFKIARMIVGLGESLSSNITFKKTDTFTVVAWKTKDFLASKRETMKFDSVYIGAENVQAEWMLKNVSDGEIIVSDRRITPLSPVVGSSGFSVITPLDTVKMPHDTHAPWTLRYRPIVRGTDSARLALVYSPNIDGKTDSTLLLLKGIGVEQQIVLSNRTSGLPNPVVIRGDTIDVGEIDVGDSTTARIIFENRGNLPFGGTVGILQENTDQFILENGLKTAQNLSVGAFDTAVVKFRPSRRGTFVTSFVVNSDIRSRIATAPDITSKLVWHIRGKAAQPELLLGSDVQDTVSFGQIILPADKTCSTAAPVRRLLARNIGNKSLAVRIDNTQLPFRILGATQRDIQPSDSSVIEIEFAPQDSGIFSSPLLLTTNEAIPSNTRPLVLTGSAIIQNVLVTLPSVVSPAGKTISVPIKVVSSVKRASVFSATLIYDTILLDFSRFDQSRTASEFATLKIDPSALPGTVRFTLNSTESSLLSSDTLIKVEFLTYFGSPAPTTLGLLRPKAGESNCDSTAFFTVENGSFSTDSSCGNAYRAILGMKGAFKFAQVGESPSRNSLEFIFETALPVETSIILYNSVGQQVQVLVQGVFGEGLQYTSASTERCGAGLYFVEMRAGIYHKLFPVFIIR